MCRYGLSAMFSAASASFLSTSLGNTAALENQPAGGSLLTRKTTWPGVAARKDQPRS